MRTCAGLLAVLAMLGGCASGGVRWEQPRVASATASAGPPSASASDVTLAFAGDVHFSDRTAGLLADPATAFGPIASVLTSADLAMVNLETAVTDRGTPEPKQFHFRAPAAAFDAVRAAGVDVVTIANNRIAFLAFSQVHELEFSWAARDDKAGEAMAGDLARATAAVRAARSSADVVVVYVHWGQEGNSCPTAEMRTFAAKMAEAGATVVLGTHAHLLLGDGMMGKTYVGYGLGNFLWWRDDAFSNDTGVLRLTLRGSEVARAELVPAVISRTTGQPLPVSGPEADRILRKYADLRGCTGLG